MILKNNYTFINIQRHIKICMHLDNLNWRMWNSLIQSAGLVELITYYNWFITTTP